jgi:hypothetical protein
MNHLHKIKELLFTKSAEKIDEFRPIIANSMFNGDNEETGEE